MKYGLVPALFFVIIFILFTPSCWGKTEPDDVLVYFRGEEIKLSLKYQDGRFYGFRPEMSQLVSGISVVEQTISTTDQEQWLQLRTYWEELGFRILWRPELNAIIISDNTGDMTLPPAALEVAKQAVADTGWLTAKNEDDLTYHFSQFYTSEQVDMLVENTWDFIKQETDWHSLYALRDAENMDRGDDWCLLKVTVCETMVSSAEPVVFHGIMKLCRTDAGWRIAFYRYLAD